MFIIWSLKNENGLISAVVAWQLDAFILQSSNSLFIQMAPIDFHTCNSFSYLFLFNLMNFRFFFSNVHNYCHLFVIPLHFFRWILLQKNTKKAKILEPKWCELIKANKVSVTHTHNRAAVLVNLTLFEKLHFYLLSFIFRVLLIFFIFYLFSKKQWTLSL